MPGEADAMGGEQWATIPNFLYGLWFWLCGISASLFQDVNEIFNPAEPDASPGRRRLPQRVTSLGIFLLWWNFGGLCMVIVFYAIIWMRKKHNDLPHYKMLPGPAFPGSARLERGARKGRSGSHRGLLPQLHVLLKNVNGNMLDISDLDWATAQSNETAKGLMGSNRNTAEEEEESGESKTVDDDDVRGTSSACPTAAQLQPKLLKLLEAHMHEHLEDGLFRWWRHHPWLPGAGCTVFVFDPDMAREILNRNNFGIFDKGVAYQPSTQSKHSGSPQQHCTHHALLGAGGILGAEDTAEEWEVMRKMVCNTSHKQKEHKNNNNNNNH